MSKVKKLASGIGWGAISSISVAVFQLVFMAVMARLLEPADFGLVAIANLSLRVLSYFAQMGIAPALVQKSEVSDQDISAALLVSMLIAFSATLAAIAMSPLAGMFFHMPSLPPVLSAIAATFLLSGFSAVSMGLLRRAMEYRFLAMIEAFSYLLGYGAVGLTLAYLDYGVWALVGATLAQSAVTTCMAYFKVRHQLFLKHTPESRRHFLSFGGRYSIIGFLEFLSFNLDAIVIGKLMGEVSAGLYNRALVIANLPIQQPATIISKALFPFLSSFSQEMEKQKIAVQLSMLGIGAYAFAVSFGISAAAEDLVAVLLGSKWLAASPILKVFVLSIGPSFISHAVGVTLDSIGALKTKIRIQMSSLALLACLMLVAVQHGIVGVATAVVLSEWIRMLIYLLVVQRLFAINKSEFAKICAVLLIFGLLAFTLIYEARILVTSYEVSTLGRLLTEIVAGAIAMLLSMLIARKLLMNVSVTQWLLSRHPKFARFLTT